MPSFFIVFVHFSYVKYELTWLRSQGHHTPTSQLRQLFPLVALTFLRNINIINAQTVRKLLTDQVIHKQIAIPSPYPDTNALGGYTSVGTPATALDIYDVEQSGY